MRTNRGSALVVALGAAVVLATLGLAMVSRTIHDSRIVEINRSYYRALYAAEAGAETVRQDLTNAFADVFRAGQQLPYMFGWLDDLAQAEESPAYDRSALSGTITGGGNYNVFINKVENPTDPIETGVRFITIRSTGINGGISKTIEVTFRVGLGPSPVFNYAYFVNNFGWFYGGGIHANGDVRSNGDFAFQGNPTVNGDAYAAANPALSAPGDIYGNHQWDTIDWYRNHTGDRSRPTDPTADPEDANGNGVLDTGEDRNGNGVLDDFEYEYGYDGFSEEFEHQDVLEMPYLGDLALYRTIATVEGGSISQGGTTIVDAVYNGDGPDGVSGTADDGCVLLVGTAADPIVIDGPVVIEKDVILRGYITGQGTIYSGRNTHVIGDLVYYDPPCWTKPDEDPETTAAVNAGKDMVGLMSKGNVVLGDYTQGGWLSTTNRYLRPPFTQSYETDPTDAPNGYDSDGYAGNGYWFDGDYTAWDGGMRNRDPSGMATERRAYYQSSVDDATVHAAATNQVNQVDAILYTNHACTGKVGAFEINGAMVARDEAIIYSGSIHMNYDMRAYAGALESIDFYLARSLGAPDILVWREIR